MENTKVENNLGKRVIAGMIDYGIIFTFFIFFVVKFGEKTSFESYEINGLTTLIPLLFWGIMTIGIETVFGATLGNFVVGLKPIPLNGNRTDYFSTISKKTFT